MDKIREQFRRDTVSKYLTALEQNPSVNKTEFAAQSKISHRTLNRWLDKYSTVCRLCGGSEHKIILLADYSVGDYRHACVSCRDQIVREVEHARDHHNLGYFNWYLHARHAVMYRIKKLNKSFDD